MGKYKYIIVMLIFYNAYSQQESQYTQYMYNMNIINPAYVINNPGGFYLGSLYRTQWTGVKGAPKTANVFANIPLSNKIELSLNYVNEEIGGVLKENSFNTDFAYILQLPRGTQLSFGIKAGVSNFEYNFSSTNVSADPDFQNRNQMDLTIGAGFFLFRDNFYLGVSAPNFLPMTLIEDTESTYEKKLQLYLTTGYVYDLNMDIKLKPSAVVRQSAGSSLSFDVSLNALFNEKFEFGASYRNQDAIAFLAAINLTDSFRIGYAYDYTTNRLSDFSNGSHEFILLYNFNISRSKRYTSPRFY